MENETMNSTDAQAFLGISSSNLRQLVFRKLLVPVGKDKRRSVFAMADLERIKASRPTKTVE